MAIIQTKDKGGKTVHKYQQPDWEILYEEVAKLLDSFEAYISVHEDIQMSDIDVNEPILGEILTRVDKRKDYFVIFHDETDMNEIKEAALLAYWILKFKPFSIKESRSELHVTYELINEAFAVFILYSAIKEESRRCSKMEFGVTETYNKKIMYGFRYWDISKEALMLVAESLCEAMHIRGRNLQ